MIDFGHQGQLPVSYLIDWACNPFLEQLAMFIKKSKQFNQSNTASAIVSLKSSVDDFH